LAQALSRSSLVSQARDLALGNDGTDVVFRAVFVEWYLWSLVDAQQIGPEPVQAGQLLVEHVVAGFPGEDPFEANPHHPGASGVGFALTSLQIGVEPPDQAVLEIEGAAMGIAQWL
jgi:hypothetical protein